MVLKMIELLTSAFWITLTVYLIFISGRWGYKKYIKPETDTFFYFLSLKRKNAEEWVLRMKSPSDDFEVEVDIMENEEIIVQKNTRLKSGVNSISIGIETDSNNNNGYTIKIKSPLQTLERKLVEAED
jgi:hypothetical protein